MAKFLEAVISSLALLAVLAAGAYFCGPMIWQHLVDSENARKVVAAQQVAIKADTAASNASQGNCAAEVTASVQAGAAIARASKPVVQVGKSQPMLTAKDIEDAIQ